MAETSTLKFFVLVSGVYFFYLWYGVYQEAIWRKEPNGERFTSTLCLLVIQCLMNAFFAFMASALYNTFGPAQQAPVKGHPTAKELSAKAETAPGYIRAVCGTRLTGHLWMGFIAFFYAFAMVASNQALQHVNYPTQALGKSCKMIPIMFANVMINQTKYSRFKYAAAFFITVGIVCFRLFGGKTKASGENSNLGLLLLLASLCLDGLTASNQTKYRNEFSTPTLRGALQMMFQTNLWACLHLGVLAFLTGDLTTGIQYIQSHPHLMSAILQFSLCSALGQIFIFLTVTGPGPLVCTTITTTRKFFTILISVFLNPNNSLTQAQWGAVGLVFLGLSAELYEKYEKKKKKDESMKEVKRS